MMSQERQASGARRQGHQWLEGELSGGEAGFCDDFWWKAASDACMHVRMYVCVCMNV